MTQSNTNTLRHPPPINCILTHSNRAQPTNLTSGASLRPQENLLSCGKAAKWQVLLIGTKQHNVFYWQNRNVLDCHRKKLIIPLPVPTPYPSLHMYAACICVCMFACVGTCVYMHVEAPSECLPQSLSTLLRQGLSIKSSLISYCR